MSPDLLPPISDIRRITQSLAMLDAILSPEWQYRYFSFNSAWNLGEEMASMRNGSGDDWFLLLNGTGAALKGFAHELADGGLLSQKIQEQVPAVFCTFLGEPAFSMTDATFCFWRKADDASWSRVSGAASEDGADDMLSLLISGPSGYQAWAEDYYEVPVPLEAVVALFSHQSLTDSVILALNPDTDLDSAYAAANEIGYPCGTASIAV